VRARYFSLLQALHLRITLQSGDEASAALLDAPPPAVIAVTFIEHIDDITLKRQRTRIVDVVHVRRRQPVGDWRLLVGIKQHVQLDALSVARSMGQAPGIKAAPLGRDRGRIQQMQQL
jgi:hypothetical protein